MKEPYLKYYENKDFIWEDKGIIITLIYYLLKNYNLYKNKTIQIKHKLYCKILNKLFKKINFNETTGILFNIKNNCNDNVCINYLDNFNNISYDKLYILPWNNYDNPLVLITKGKTKLNKTIIKNKINNLKYHLSSKYPYLYDNIEEINDKFDMDNKTLESYVLRKFCKKLTKNINYKKIRKYINKKLVPITETTKTIYQYNSANNIVPSCPIITQVPSTPIVQTVTKTVPVKEKYDFQPLFKSITNKLQSLNDFIKK